MKNTIEQIIRNNTPEKATEKILLLIAKNESKSFFTKEDVREAFEGGQENVEAHIGYERWGDDTYAYKTYNKKFNEWLNDYSNKNKTALRNRKIISLIYNQTENGKKDD